MSSATNAIITTIAEKLEDAINCPQCWDAESYETVVKLLDKGTKHLALYILKSQEVYPFKNLGELSPFVEAVLKDAFKSIDWQEVSSKLTPKIKEFREVAAKEIAEWDAV